MILKIQLPEFSDHREGWVYRDNIANLMHYPSEVTKEQIDKGTGEMGSEGTAYLPNDLKLDEYPVIVFELQSKEDIPKGIHHRIVVGTQAFILNDEGQTVERWRA